MNPVNLVIRRPANNLKYINFILFILYFCDFFFVFVLFAGRLHVLSTATFVVLSCLDFKSFPTPKNSQTPGRAPFKKICQTNPFSLFFTVFSVQPLFVVFVFF